MKKPDPHTRAAIRQALTELAHEHETRSMNNGPIGDMHLLAQQRAEAFRDHFYPAYKA